MVHLNFIDYSVIGLYFAFLIALGLYLKKRASASLEDYFLGGRSMPWWMLGIAGTASYVDITGSMLLVSYLFLLGSKGVYMAFRGTVFFHLAILMIWIGKWQRRSGCITGAEWMVFRFGDGLGGQFARGARALAEIAVTVGMLAYMVKGVGLFLSMFFPFTPLTCAIIMISIATAYTMVSGFYGVIISDLFQSLIIFGIVVGIAVLATVKSIGHGDLAGLASEVTGISDWASSIPKWTMDMPKGYEVFSHLTTFALLYMFRNIVFGMGGGEDDPRYFAARNDRECGTLTFMWSSLMALYWPMLIGFAVLGIFLIKQFFPDQAVLAQAAEMITGSIGQVEASRWPDKLAGIINNPEQYGELAANLKNLLGQGWENKLQLVNFDGTVNAERIVPAVIINYIPKGLTGVFLVGLIAASMSTFDIRVNKAAGFFTRDFYQRYVRPKASNSELIYASWAFCIAIVVLAFIMGYRIKTINEIWGWIVMGLWGGLIVPIFLRYYWWRFNGSGFAAGMIVGLITAFAQRKFFPNLDEIQQFGLIASVSLVFTIIGTYLGRPTDPEVLKNFYTKTRPFGFWGPLKKTVSPELRAEMKREHRNDLLALPFALVWQVTLAFLPVQLLAHSFKQFFVTLAASIVCMLGMYVFWYRNLPAKSVKQTETSV